MSREAGTVDVSLESLGLKVSNAPPRFVLNQRETEDDGMPSLPDGFVFISNTGSEDGASIVVLGNTSLDALQMQTLTTCAEIQQKSMAVDCKSIISSLTAPEVEDKLTEVLRENARLKETLEKNNSSMKEVLNNLASKQREVSRVHEEHKRQFAETKNLVQVLRAENNEYKMKIEKLNGESANQSGQMGAREDDGTASVALNEMGDESKVAKLMEKCEKENHELARMRTAVASLEQQLESARKAYEELFRLHEEQKDEFAATKDLVNVLRSENDENKIKMEVLYRESTNRSMQTESNEETGESEVTKLTEKCGKEDQDITRMHALIASLEQRLEFDRKEHEELSGVHEAHTRELAETKNLVKVLRTEADAYKMRMEELNRENANRPVQTEAQKDKSTASVVLNDKADESEVTKLVEKCDNQNREITRMHAIIASLERQLASTSEDIAGKGNQESQSASVPQEKSQEIEDVITLLESMRYSREEIKLELVRDRTEMARECSRLQEAERKLVEANVSLHEEVAAMRESNEVLNAQLAVFEVDFTEQRKLCDTMRQKETELLGLIENLENEKDQWVETMRYFEQNSDA